MVHIRGAEQTSAVLRLQTMPGARANRCADYRCPRTVLAKRERPLGLVRMTRNGLRTEVAPYLCKGCRGLRMEPSSRSPEARRRIKHRYAR